MESMSLLLSYSPKILPLLNLSNILMKSNFLKPPGTPLINYTDCGNDYQYYSNRQKYIKIWKYINIKIYLRKGV
jgi:hypothetical protein